MKNSKRKIIYTEPASYFPKSIREKAGFTEKKTTKKKTAKKK